MTYHRAASRGKADHGWLQSRHTFSFADYHDPERMGFGLLRVLNDDWVEPGKGFGTHPHRDMEIVSIPLQGALRHQDSMGNQHIIATGDVQRMSAGTGVTHSEYNASDHEWVNFLQIWVLPDRKGIAPGYGQKRFDPAHRQNRFQTVVAPDGRDGAIPINQASFFAMASIHKGRTVRYRLNEPRHGVYVFVISGQTEVGGVPLQERDGVGIESGDEIDVLAGMDTEILTIEVPMY
jgi:redox-sensitive bicupin YhaK (pirin superfamily)